MTVQTFLIAFILVHFPRAMALLATALLAVTSLVPFARCVQSPTSLAARAPTGRPFRPVRAPPRPA